MEKRGDVPSEQDKTDNKQHAAFWEKERLIRRAECDDNISDYSVGWTGK